MKMILEVLSYGPGDIRFRTDFHTPVSRETLQQLLYSTMHSMSTDLWGGDEMAVLAMIRMLALADLSLCVNREEIIRCLDSDSADLAQAFREVMEEMTRQGRAVLFPPGVNPTKTKS